MTGTTKTMDVSMSIITRSTVASVSKVEPGKRNSGTAQASFDGILNKASSAVMNTSKSFNPKEKTLQVDVKKPVSDNSSKKIDNSANDNNKAKVDDNKELNNNPKDEKSQITDEKVKETTNQTDKTTKETGSKEADGKLQEAIEEKGRKLVSEIAEAFDISEDEILSAMETLGLMMGDLLKPQNIQMLVTNLVGEDKSLDLITNSDLNAIMQDLFEDAKGMKSELMNELDESLSREDFKNLIKDNAQTVDQSLRNVGVKEPEIILHEKMQELPKDLKASQSKDLSSEIKVDTPEISEETTFKPVETTSETANDNNRNGNFSQHGNEQGANLFNQLLNNITQNMDVAPTETAQYTNRAQMENIIRQITDRITITHAETESSIELHLHPASLGNVNILLSSSKDGIVAKFTAQNEIVKEAVESQMMTLQQKFSEQGIKVTSIEVTIASHAFEQNLQQDDRNSGYEQQQSKNKRPLRRINLTEGIDFEDEDDVSDADRIAAQMMAANGNTVDYSA